MLVTINRCLRGKGQGIVEYAVVLAFVIIVGVYIFGSGGLKDEVLAPFNKTTSVLSSS